MTAHSTILKKRKENWDVGNASFCFVYIEVFIYEVMFNQGAPPPRRAMSMQQQVK